MRTRLLRSLPAGARAAVRAIVSAQAAGAVYAVGGSVRDLILGRQIVDLDLAVECDAAALVRRALPGAKITAHARFGTASVTVDGVRIDVATARRETYDRPGALPKVAPASIVEDLHRRDFSMNAIALRLDGRATLLDPCGGVADIAAHRVRVLHDGSLRDDATRIFRAFRYAARLGFSLDAHTAALLRDGIAHVAAIGGERLRRELELLLGETTAGAALEACARAGALLAVHPALRWDSERGAALASDATADIPRIPYGFALLVAGGTPAEAAAVTLRLKLKRAEAAAVGGVTAMATVATMLKRRHAKPSGVVMLLDRYPLASVAAFAATADGAIARQLVLRYLAEWRQVKPLLSGRDLQEFGVPNGPQVQRGLQLIRAARLDGWANSRDDERALARRFVKSIRNAGAMKAPIKPHFHAN
jgi:tRNA nucleotidyltransferase (CCA-adding enzyme)